MQTEIKGIIVHGHTGLRTGVMGHVTCVEVEVVVQTKTGFVKAEGQENSVPVGVHLCLCDRTSIADAFCRYSNKARQAASGDGRAR